MRATGHHICFSAMSDMSFTPSALRGPSGPCRLRADTRAAPRAAHTFQLRIRRSRPQLSPRDRRESARRRAGRLRRRGRRQASRRQAQRPGAAEDPENARNAISPQSTYIWQKLQSKERGGGPPRMWHCAHRDWDAMLRDYGAWSLFVAAQDRPTAEIQGHNQIHLSWNATQVSALFYLNAGRGTGAPLQPSTLHTPLGSHRVWRAANRSLSIRSCSPRSEGMGRGYCAPELCLDAA